MATNNAGRRSLLACVGAAAACAALAALGIFAPATSAWADGLDEVPIPDKFQEEVERTAAEYEEAKAAAAEARKAADENSARIDELTAQIPGQQARSAEAARELYKLQQQKVGILELIFSSDDLDALLTNIDYISRIAESHTDELVQLTDMKTELSERQKELREARSSANKNLEKAKTALKEAKQARVEAQKRAQEEARKKAEEEKRRLAEAAERIEAQAAGQAAAAAQAISARGSQVLAAGVPSGTDAEDQDATAAETASASKGEEAAAAEGDDELDAFEKAAAEDADSASEITEKADQEQVAAENEQEAQAEEESSSVEVGQLDQDPQAAAYAQGSQATQQDALEEALAADEEVVFAVPENDGADWTQDKDVFVAEWGGRIDAYLAGSALAGQGETFAKAAWAYGIDPRWSPAIACTESSLGAACFKPHNAWGWGQSSWNSWEEAIDAHVAAMARGYGYTITVGAAQTYCPPNWVHWYNNTVTEMNRI